MNIKEEILSRTNRGLEIFCFYVPIDFVPKRNFRNPLYADRRVSCNIYLDNKSGCYRMKDFGNDAYSGDCFWFAAVMLGLDVRKDFMVVLETIIRDLQLNMHLERKEYHAQRVPMMKPYERMVLPPGIHTASTANEKWFKYIEQPFGESELNYWWQYGIDAKTLQRFRVKSLTRYESIAN